MWFFIQPSVAHVVFHLVAGWQAVAKCTSETHAQIHMWGPVVCNQQVSCYKT